MVVGACLLRDICFVLFEVFVFFFYFGVCGGVCVCGYSLRFRTPTFSFHRVVFLSYNHFEV